MIIPRDMYLNRLLSSRHDGFVKIVTGVRRCGKSHLLFRLFRERLIEEGVKPADIVMVVLDDDDMSDLRNPILLGDWLRRRLRGRRHGWKYVFIDEIQMIRKTLHDGVDLSKIAPDDRESAYITFYDVLNGLLKIPETDIYVTGSNSKMLSSDIATNFRDRGEEIRLHPLTFYECLAVSRLEKAEAWEQYLVYGGMPGAVLAENPERKRDYLSQLFKKVYFKDIVERHALRHDQLLETVTDTLFSAVGSLTNPTRIANTANSSGMTPVSQPTVKKYIDILEDAFLVNRADRYDVKGRRYLEYPSKYYAEDVGLRNSRLNFRQVEETHLMENVIYNELTARGHSVDVGFVEETTSANGKRTKRQLEIDFIVNDGPRRAYVQSAFAIPDEEKRRQETAPLRASGDFFRKLVVTSGFRPPLADSDGIVHVGIIPFLLDPSILFGG